MKKPFRNPIDLFLRKKLHLLIENEILEKVGFTMDDDLALWCELRPHYNYYNLHYYKNREGAIIRKQGFDLHRYNKFEEKELMKSVKKSMDMFIAFWDFVEDNDPKWCFVSGNYIPPRFRGTIAVQPFKDGEWCYKEKYDRYLKWNVVSDKLTEESELICIATKPNKPRDFTIRPHVRNNESSIRKHIRDNPLGFEDDDRCENIGNWKMIRAKYFLKPNGSRFSRVR
jgi:hypothetical protein